MDFGTKSNINMGVLKDARKPTIAFKESGYQSADLITSRT